MKFDVFQWSEVNINAQIQAQKGRLQLRTSAQAALYIQAEGYEALAGVGTSFDVEVAQAVTFRLEAPKGVRAFFYEPASSVALLGDDDKVVFTNIDRMPSDSGNLSEVQKAIRLFELQRRSALRELREERDAVRRERLATERAQADVHDASGDAGNVADPAESVNE